MSSTDKQGSPVAWVHRPSVRSFAFTTVLLGVGVNAFLPPWNTDVIVIALKVLENLLLVALLLRIARLRLEAYPDRRTLVVRNILRTYELPYEEVASVEVARGYPRAGVELALKNNERVRVMGMTAVKDAFRLNFPRSDELTELDALASRIRSALKVP